MDSEALSGQIEVAKQRAEEAKRALIRSTLKRVEWQQREDIEPAQREAIVREVDRSCARLQAIYTVQAESAHALESDRVWLKQREESRALLRQLSESPSPTSRTDPELGAAMRRFGLGSAGAKARASGDR